LNTESLAALPTMIIRYPHLKGARDAPYVPPYWYTVDIDDAKTLVLCSIMRFALVSSSFDIGFG